MTVRTKIGDGELQRRVEAELKWYPDLDASEVSVAVREGVVTLRGLARSLEHARRARDAAHCVGGVLDVVDELQVRPLDGSRDDQAIARAVRNALEWDPFVPDRDVRTTVADGCVTLEGEVSRWNQRHEAERTVARLAGVRGVENRITVVPGPIDARSIQGSIEEALTRRAQREARRVQVSVDRGKVTLRGSVHSWGEKNALARLAGHAPGVVDVVDLTAVDPYA